MKNKYLFEGTPYSDPTDPQYDEFLLKADAVRKARDSVGIPFEGGHLVLNHDSSPEVTYRETNVNATVGRFFRMKYKDFTECGSYYEAAKNLRKQGVPVGIALLILTGRA